GVTLFLGAEGLGPCLAFGPPQVVGRRRERGQLADADVLAHDPAVDVLGARVEAPLPAASFPGPAVSFFISCAASCRSRTLYHSRRRQARVSRRQALRRTARDTIAESGSPASRPARPGRLRPGRTTGPPRSAGCGGSPARRRPGCPAA